MIQRSRPASRQSRKFIERRQSRLVLSLALSMVAMATCLFVVSQLTRLDFLTLSEAKVSGADPDISASLEAAALDALKGSYLGLFNKANFLIYPRRAVVEAVTKASPKVVSADVQIQGLRSLVVSVKERAPAALVCLGLPDFLDGELSFGSDDDCYFADDSGFIFAPAPAFSDGVYNRLYVPDLAETASTTSVIGLLATSTAEFRALRSVYDQARSASIQGVATLIKGGGEYELYIHNPGRNPSATSSDSDLAVVYFNNSRSFAEQFSNLILFWKKMVAPVASKKEPISFEYLDVRYGSNVFYRLNK